MENQTNSTKQTDHLHQQRWFAK